MSGGRSFTSKNFVSVARASFGPSTTNSGSFLDDSELLEMSGESDAEGVGEGGGEGEAVAVGRRVRVKESVKVCGCEGEWVRV